MGENSQYHWTTEMISDPANELGELGQAAELIARRVVPVPHVLRAVVLRREYDDDDPRKAGPGYGEATIKFLLETGDGSRCDTDALEKLVNDLVVSELIGPIPDTVEELL